MMLEIKKENLQRSPKKLRRFSKNLRENLEKVRRFFDFLPRFWTPLRRTIKTDLKTEDTTKCRCPPFS